MRAAVDPRAALVCDRGCDEAPGRSVDAVEDALGAQLVAAGGRPGGGSCGCCSERLELPARATVRSVTVEPPSGDPYTITFTLPLVRCGACGLDNVPPGLGDDVRRSALGACGLPVAPARRSPLAALVRRRRRRDAPGSPGRP